MARSSAKIKFPIIYVSRREGLVLIHVEHGDPIVVSPDNPQEFVNSVPRAVDMAKQRQSSQEDGE